LARRATGLEDLVDLEAFRVSSHFGAGAPGSRPSFGR
jgi:hypothetical protein